MSRHTPRPPLTEADRESQTRFGPRPVPEGHRTASPYPHRKMMSSAVPPSGKVSPDGRQAWPQPSLTARIIVWGGLAAGVAGLTAAAALAARKLSAPDADDSAQARSGSSPRFAALDEDAREEMRRRVRAQAREDATVKAEARARASRLRPSTGNAARDLTKTATDLSGGLNATVGSVLSAFEAFQRVAVQARSVIAEFTKTADQIRAMAGQRPSATGTNRRPADPADRSDRMQD